MLGFEVEAEPAHVERLDAAHLVLQQRPVPCRGLCGAVVGQPECLYLVLGEAVRVHDPLVRNLVVAKLLEGLHARMAVDDDRVLRSSTLVLAVADDCTAKAELPYQRGHAVNCLVVVARFPGVWHKII